MTTITNKDGIPFDIDAIATDVNGKADRDLINVSSNVSVCIESWHEGTEWYRVYSDGWCKQGGQISMSSTSGTTNLHKVYADANYSILTTPYRSSGYAYQTTINAKTVSSFSWRIDSKDSYIGTMWQAEGYIR